MFTGDPLQINSSLVILTTANKVESILSLTGGGGSVRGGEEGGLSKAAGASGAARAAAERLLQSLFTQN